MATYFDSNGIRFNIGNKIGSGGEGAVYQIEGKPGFVAKVYHHPVPKEKSEKLLVMKSIANDQILKIAAWPIELLFNERKQIVGFVMPIIANAEEIHVLWSPKSRKHIFPKADWTFLLHVSTNIAIAFHTLHSNRIIVGDINQSSIFVKHDGTVVFADCDSFQIECNGKRFFCDVGVMAFQPPEFQSLTTLRGVERSQNHDNFGLSLIIFQSLFMGRHPYAGVPLDGKDTSLEDCIASYRFAYGSNARQKQIQQPPNSIPTTAVTQRIMALFQKAFSEEGTIKGRPLPEEWIIALSEFKKQIRICAINTNHLYYQGLFSCPWCQLEQNIGFLLFEKSITSSIRPIFDINSIWATIQSIPIPSICDLSKTDSFKSLPTIKGVISRKISMVFIWIICISSGFVPPFGFNGILFLAILAVTIVFSIKSSRKLNMIKEDFKLTHKNFLEKYESFNLST